MPVKLIAVANMKGGVGKTTTVVSLAETLAAGGSSVLVVDLDPQANASVCLAGDDLLTRMIAEGRTLDHFLDERLLGKTMVDAASMITREKSGVTHRNAPLDVRLFASGAYLRLIERELIYNLASGVYNLATLDGQLRRLLHTSFVKADMGLDYILFDCAPGISPVTEAALRVSDLIVAPTIPDFMSTYVLNAFHHEIWLRRSRGEPAPKRPPHVLITRYMANVRQHREVCDELEAEAARPKPWLTLFKTRVPQSAKLAAALAEPAGVTTFAQKYGPPFITSVLAPLAVELKGFVK